MTKLPRFIEKEISRIKKLEGFKLFLASNTEKILDTDFYSYLGVSVRTDKDEFLGRLKTIQDIISELRKRSKKEEMFNKIIDYHGFILDKFKEIIDYYNKN